MHPATPRGDRIYERTTSLADRRDARELRVSVTFPKEAAWPSVWALEIGPGPVGRLPGGLRLDDVQIRVDSRVDAGTPVPAMEQLTLTARHPEHRARGLPVGPLRPLHTLLGLIGGAQPVADTGSGTAPATSSAAASAARKPKVSAGPMVPPAPG